MTAKAGVFHAKLDGVQVLTPDDWGPPLPIGKGPALIRPIVGPGMGARERTLNHFDLGPGACTVETSHCGEAVYFVVRGEATAYGPDRKTSIELSMGAMLHVEPGERYSIGTDTGAVLIGGACPVDEAPPPREGEGHEGVSL